MQYAVVAGVFGTQIMFKDIKDRLDTHMISNIANSLSRQVATAASEFRKKNTDEEGGGKPAATTVEGDVTSKPTASVEQNDNNLIDLDFLQDDEPSSTSTANDDFGAFEQAETVQPELIAVQHSPPPPLPAEEAEAKAWREKYVEQSRENNTLQKKALAMQAKVNRAAEALAQSRERLEQFESLEKTQNRVAERLEDFCVFLSADEIATFARSATDVKLELLVRKFDVATKSHEELRQQFLDKERTIESLQEDLRVAETKTAEVEEQLNLANVELQAAQLLHDDAKKKLLTEKKDLVSELEQLRIDQANVKAELLKEIDDREVAIVTARNEAAEIKKRFDEIHESAATRNDLQEQLVDRDSELASLNARLEAETNQRNEELEEARVLHEETVRKLNLKISELEETIQKQIAQQRETEDAKLRSDEIEQATVDDLQEKIIEMDSVLASTAGHAEAELDAKTEDFDEARVLHEETVRKLNLRISELEDALQDEIAKHRDTSDSQRRSEQDEQAAADDLQEQLVDRDGELASQNARFEKELDYKKQDSDETRVLHEETVRKLNLRISELEEALQKHSENPAIEKVRKESALEEEEELCEQVEELETTLEEQESEMDAKNSEIESLKRKLEEVRRKEAASTDELSELRSKVEELEEALRQSAEALAIQETAFKTEKVFAEKKHLEQVEQLTATISAKDEAAEEAIQQQNTESLQTIADLKSALTEKETAIAKLEQQLGEAVGKHSEAESIASATIEALRKEVVDLTSAAAQASEQGAVAAEKDKDELVGQIEKLTSSIAEKEKNIAAIQEELRQAESRAQTAEKALTASEALLVERNKQLAAAKENTDRLESAVADKDALAQKIENLTAEVSERDAALAKLREQFEEARAAGERLEKAQETVVILRAQLEQSTAAVHEKDREIGQLAQQKDKLNAEIQDLRNAVSQRETAITDLETQLFAAQSNQQEALQASESDQDALKKEIERLTAEAETAKATATTEVAILTEQRDGLTSEVETLKSTISQKESEAAELKEELQSLQNSHESAQKEAEASMAAQETKVEALKSNLTELESEVHKAAAQSFEIDDLRVQLEETQARVDDMRSHLEEKEAELAEVQKRGEGAQGRKLRQLERETRETHDALEQKTKELGDFIAWLEESIAKSGVSNGTSEPSSNVEAAKAKFEASLLRLREERDDLVKQLSAKQQSVTEAALEIRSIRPAQAAPPPPQSPLALGTFDGVIADNQVEHFKNIIMKYMVEREKLGEGIKAIVKVIGNILNMPPDQINRLIELDLNRARGIKNNPTSVRDIYGH